MTDRGLRQTTQCRSCPWRVETDPTADIPNGYDRTFHERLRDCNSETGRIMACHQSPLGDEYACVGWLFHELGPGNNIPLRMRAIKARLGELSLSGEQHGSFDDTLKSDRLTIVASKHEWEGAMVGQQDIFRPTSEPARSFYDVIRTEAKLRHTRQDWIEQERTAIWRSVRDYAQQLGLSVPTLASIQQVEAMAVGHIDYAAKLAIGIAEKLGKP